MSGTTNAPARKTLRNLGIFIAAIVCFLFILLITSPEWHDKYFGVAKNESSAVLRLREINSLEKRYAGSHPEKGFTCQLPLLRDEGLKANELEEDSELSEKWRGYKFALLACMPGANGTITRYQVTAVPTRPYGTGVRAFCSDESGEVMYDVEGSASQCLTARRALD